MATTKKTSPAAGLQALRKSLEREKAKSARLEKKLTESLEQQTAISEILRVISSSPSDVQPVLKAVAERAARICAAQFVDIVLAEGEMLRVGAAIGAIGRPGGAEPVPLDRTSVMGRSIVDRASVHVADLQNAPESEYPLGRTLARKYGHRTILAVPLVREDRALGTILLRRTEVRPFDRKHVALLKTFANQAAIAIENVRLFNETKEALERQTATSEILKVISSSPTDTQPVFDVIARSGVRLFDGLNVAILLRKDPHFVLAGYSGPGMEDLPAEIRTAPLDPEKNFPSRAILDGTVLHVTDWEGDDVPEHEKVVAKAFGIKSGLMVPLLRQGEGIGAIAVLRAKAGPFQDKDIALLQSFADQAVIAIENVRLFDETKEALERQTATAEILKVISSSPTDVQPVFDIIGRLAEKLCAAEISVVSRFDGALIRLAALHGVAKEAVETVRRVFPMRLDEETVTARAYRKSAVIHIADVLADPEYTQKHTARAGGWRGALGVPMVREGQVIGVIFVARTTPGYFADAQVELLRTFADQAVIAIENVRLFNETREALERQTATAEILKVIASSPSDVQPVFDAIAGNGVRLCGAGFGVVFRCDGEVITLAAVHNVSQQEMEGLGRIWPMRPDPESIVGRTVLERHVINVHDYQIEFPKFAPLLPTIRSIVSVPMLRGDVPIGVLGIFRRELAPFTRHQIDLLQTFADQAVIAIENVRLFNETRDALERQTASAEVLASISGSMTDAKPVFDTIARNVQRLIGTRFAVVQVVRDGIIEMPAAAGEPGFERLTERYPRPLDDSTTGGRAMLSMQVQQLTPVLGNPLTPAPVEQFARDFGFNSVLFAPMLREGKVVGAIGAAHREAVPFDDKQVALIRTFADQAVIAIENVRLFNETKEALERQTAISEILRVISDSPSDVKPVLDAVAERAARICEARVVDIVLAEGGSMLVAAHIGDLGRPVGDIIALDRTTVMGRSIVDRASVQVADLQNAGDEFPRGRELALKYGHRTILAVPLLREGRALGTILVRRAEVRPFDDKHIALLRTFADQAAIAIENARLFNETKEALERQTAMAEVLQVISASMADTAPVFDKILQSCKRLFSSAEHGILLVAEDGRVRIAAHHGSAGDRVTELVAAGLADGLVQVEAIRQRKALHFVDALAEEARGPVQRIAQRLGIGSYSQVVAPMLWEDQPVGWLYAIRQPATGFREAEIALLKAFADQAVIAIQNARLFNETKEALEQQTATSEILRVMSSSPGDVQPVFDAVARKASELCSGNYAVVTRFDGELIHLAAQHNPRPGSSAPTAQQYPRRPGRDIPSARAVLEQAVVHIPHADKDPDLPPALVRRIGAGSFLAVPLLREGRAIGAIGVSRAESGAFPARQIELVKLFADQAVIAIENVRLFNETKEALERQTATAEILKVISESPSDIGPVFRAILEKAIRLSGSQLAVLWMYEGGDTFRAVEGYGQRPEFSKWVYGRTHRFGPPFFRVGGPWRAGQVVDVRETEPYRRGDEIWIKSVEIEGIRTALMVPLVREKKFLGGIAIYRREVQRFTSKQIELVSTFADQAVIAIENVRLFKELQARTEALTRSVGQLTALGEVGQAISSTLDLETVLKTIVSRAVQLSGLNGGSIYEFEEASGDFHLRAAENMPEEMAEVYRRMPIRLGESIVGGAAAKREPMQVPDIQDESYQTRYRELLIRQGYRAILAVPLLRDEQIIGALTVSRNEPGAFAPEVVELLKTFATQSALAIQNARLFREIAEKGRQLEVASRHKSDFLASMSHELRTPLNAILGFNEMILGQVYGEVPADMKEPLADIQASGKHLLRLINNVLDLAKIEAGRMELALSDYSVQDTVENVRSTLRPLAAEKGLEFLVHVPSGIPLAYGDGGRITQCLMNLAGNALKFTKAGKVEISVEEEGELLTYRVADTGIGIPPDKIEHLFTEFKQSDATIASEYGGTGLGLSISRKFVEMHGGRIWVESELGKGSAFLFEIPLRVREGAAA